MRRRGAALLLWALLAAARPAPAADEAASLPIIVVDLQAVMRESAAAVDIRRQIEALRGDYQDQFDAVEAELRAAADQLTEDRTTLPPEELLAKQRDFQERVVEMQREAQAVRTAFDRASDRAMETVRTALLDIVTDLARERGATIVLNKEQVLLMDQGLDISDEALSRLNERLPSVQVEITPR